MGAGRQFCERNRRDGDLIGQSSCVDAVEVDDN
jgi:hypothetical protein